MVLKLNQVHSLCAALLSIIKTPIKIQLLLFIGQKSHFDIIIINIHLQDGVWFLKVLSRTLAF